ncbi:MAG: hypothetical protein KDD38_11205, partial [Bdellovibrionales bacterium]|nr:hypothetical protein [Bdellovibrionales bacterium]
AENWVGARAAHTKSWDGAVSSLQHVGLAYDLGNDKKIQFRQYFFYNYTDAAKTNETELGDHVVKYSDAKALKLGDADMSFEARMYIPGSEYAREAGKYELRLSETVAQQFSSKFSVEYSLNTRLYTYSSDSAGQRGLRVIPAVQAKYAANKVFTPYISAYTDSSWYNRGLGKNLFGSRAGTQMSADSKSSNTDAFGTDIGTEIALTDNIGLDLYLETEKDLRSAGAFDVANEDLNTYNLVFSASL